MVSCYKYALCAFALWGAAEAKGDMLTGDTGAVRDSAMAININPANAGFVPRTQVEMGLIPLQSNEIQVHYPGMDTIDQKSANYSLPEAMPAYVYKVNSRFGISIMGTPALPVSVPLQIKKVPLVVLDTYDTVDISARGKLYGYANLVAGYRLSDNFGIGLRLDYLSVGADTSIKPTDGTSSLGGISFKMTSMGVTLGLRGSLMHDTIGIGVASRIYDLSTLDINSDGAFSSPGNADSKSTGANQGVVMRSVIIGTRIRLARQVTFNVDGQYDRQPEPATGFSLVTLQDEKKDVYPTFALRGGCELRLKRTLGVLAGGAYQPAEIGPGTRGDNAKSGFGSAEMLQIYALGGDLKPYWQVGGGFKFNLKPIHGNYEKKREKAQEHEKWRGDEAYAYTIALGIVFRRSSLGIDANGEQPGSYLQTRYLFPLTVTARN